MGCSCTKPVTSDTIVTTQPRSVSRKTHLSQPPRHLHLDHQIQTQDVIKLTKEIVNKHFNDDIDLIVLATLVMLESRGCPELLNNHNTNGDSALTRIGLCQLTLFRCQQLFKEKAFNAYGEPTISTLKDARINLYFGAAHIQSLIRQGGQKHDEEFVVQNFRVDSKRKLSQDGCGNQLYWIRYQATKKKLGSLYRAIQRVEKSEQNEEVMHVIREGESISKIARMCMLDIADIMAFNNKVLNPEFFRPGDCISIPISKSIPRLYAAKKGESIVSIARRHTLTLGRLLKANPDISETDIMYNGQLLRIPGIRGDSQTSFTQGTVPKDSGMLLTCQRGETLQQICEQFQVRVRDVVVLNDLDDWSMVRRGQRLIIPDNLVRTQ
eukprot:TRINITY_DN5708_c7_g1_i1.p1 TRINITY_DN5708_c7_g1~~TRINITY_DN5708_c7_g1_i1.p1  ORF type:complete len:381 (-),score=26.28 TRINITY_DN5708_c7_g1_i1:1048-2190(-)